MFNIPFWKGNRNILNFDKPRMTSSVLNYKLSELDFLFSNLQFSTLINQVYLLIIYSLLVKSLS